MSHVEDASPELLSLLSAICDDETDQDNLNRLERSAGQHPDGIGLIFDYLQLHGDLRFELIGRKVSAPVLHEINDVSVEAIAVAPFSAQHADTGIDSVLPPLPGLGVLPGTIGIFSSSWAAAYLLATVITGLGLWICSHIYVVAPEQVARRVDSLPSPLSPVPSAVGRITGMVGCQFKAEGSTGLASGTERGRRKAETLESRVSLGDNLALSSGLLEITYNTGAKVILQGPVSYQVESNGGFLSLGKLTGKLEKSISSSSFILHPSSFTIHTPTATVTDLGTEFGVEVSDSGATETNVFVGAVQVARIGGKNAADAPATVVRAGQFAQVAASTVTPVSVSQRRLDAMAKRFARAMPKTPSTADAYGDLVLSMHPAAYYRMERPSDPAKQDVVFDSAPGGHHGTVYGVAEYGGGAWTNGRFGSGLYLSGGEYAVVRDLPHSDADQISVAAWVYGWCGDQKSVFTIASRQDMRHEGTPSSLFLGLWSGSLMAQVRQRDGGDVRILHGGISQLFSHGQWQHVAFVADGSVLRLYCDGAEVAAARCDGVQRVSPVRDFTIGCGNVALKSDPPDMIKPHGLWTGRIDELAVFNHALSAEQVRQLFAGAAAKPAGSKEPSRR
jgi:hypothetical protein